MYSKGGGGGGVGGTGVFVPEKEKEKKGEFLKHGERCNKIMGGWGGGGKGYTTTS